jgi:hypothetical protein
MQQGVDQQHLSDGDGGERIFEDHGALPSGPMGAFGKRAPIVLTRASARYLFAIAYVLQSGREPGV